MGVNSCSTHQSFGCMTGTGIQFNHLVEIMLRFGGDFYQTPCFVMTFAHNYIKTVALKKTIIVGIGEAFVA